MKFIDHIEISIAAGHGGNGLCSFMRQAFQPRLGPDGGDGGHGGHVIFEGNKGLSTLSSLRYHKTYKAQNGDPGGPNSRTGKSGEDLIVPVPLGTIGFERETNTKKFEITGHGQQIKIATGGIRGLGNIRFAKATRQIPEIATAGTEGEEFDLNLELKLMADIGLVGFPNAGKSTLLSRISHATPKIADYPFTTLTPQLGVVDIKNSEFDLQSYVIADIPGLIEGASDGKGLGHEFLRHIQRNAGLLFVLNGDPSYELSPKDQYHALKAEVFNYCPITASKPFQVILTKKDLWLETDEHSELKQEWEDELNKDDIEFTWRSSWDSSSLESLKRDIFELVNEGREHQREIEEEEESKRKELERSPSSAEFRSHNEYQFIQRPMA